MGPRGVKGFLGVKGPPVSKQLIDQVMNQIDHIKILVKHILCYQGHHGGLGIRGAAGPQVTRTLLTKTE